MKIAIIGGGYTGLVAAYKLSKDSKNQVTIYEAGSEVGGLASGFRMEGENLERVYHHIFKSDKDIIDLVKELGIYDKLHWFDSSVANYSKGKLFPFSSPSDLLNFSALPFIDRLRLGAVSLYCRQASNYKQFINISAYDWMKKWAGDKVLKVLWEPLLKGKFSDKYYQKVSMAWLWARLHTRVAARDKDDIKNEKLGYFEHGFQIIVDTLVEKLQQANVNIQTNAKITAIKEGEKPKLLLENSTSETEFDKIIVTTPSSVFAKLISENSSVTKGYLDKLNSIDYIGAVCMVFSSEQDLSKYYWHNILDTSFPFLVFINHTKLTPKSWYNNKNVYYIGTYQPHESELFNMNDQDLKALWFSKIKNIFHDFDSSKVHQLNIFRFKNAQHIVDKNYDKKIPDYTTPIENVYLSNFSQIFPEDRGTNFAVREGNKIASLALK